MRRRPQSASLGAAALVALGPLSVTPLAIADAFWVGPQLFGASLGTDWLYAVLGLVAFAGAVLPLACVALGVSAWRGSRRAMRLGAGLASTIGLLSLSPVHSLSPLSWIAGGRWLLVVLALGTAALLIAGARAADTSSDPGLGPVPKAASAVLGLALLAGAVAGQLRDDIPEAPSGLLAAEFRGDPDQRGEPLDGSPPDQARGLYPGQWSGIHNDGAMSDAYFGRPVIDPASAEVRSFGALGDCASLLFDRGGRIVAVCVGGTRIAAYILDPVTLEPIAEREIGERSVGLDFATNFAGGGYAVLDDRKRLVIPTADGTVRRFTLGADSIDPLDEFDVTAALGAEEPITSALPDDSRRIWFVGSEGSVGVLDPRDGSSRAIRFEDADIENSFALVPGGGAIVVTSKELVRLEIARDGGPRIVWRRGYDNGERLKPGQTSRASGTTPTLMLGGRFVAITDNAEPQMHVQVYSAKDGALACETPVFESGKSATENSLIAVGPALFVENNYGYKLFSVLGGHSAEPGAARVDFDPRDRTCELVWENDQVRIPSVVSKVSAADGAVLTYTKPAEPAGIDAWYFTAIDAGTGEVMWERRAGTGPAANNHYAALYLGPSGNLYVGTVGGVIGLVDPAGG